MPSQNAAFRIAEAHNSAAFGILDSRGFNPGPEATARMRDLGVPRDLKQHVQVIHFRNKAVADAVRRAKSVSITGIAGAIRMISVEAHPYGWCKPAMTSALEQFGITLYSSKLSVSRRDLLCLAEAITAAIQDSIPEVQSGADAYCNTNATAAAYRKQHPDNPTPFQALTANGTPLDLANAEPETLLHCLLYQHSGGSRQPIPEMAARSYVQASEPAAIAGAGTGAAAAQVVAQGEQGPEIGNAQPQGAAPGDAAQRMLNGAIRRGTAPVIAKLDESFGVLEQVRDAVLAGQSEQAAMSSEISSVLAQADKLPQVLSALNELKELVRSGAPGAQRTGEVAASAGTGAAEEAAADRQLSPQQMQRRTELMMRISSLLNAQPASDAVGLHKQIYAFGKQFASAIKEAAAMGQLALVVRMATAMSQGFTAAHEAMSQLGTYPRNGMSAAATIGVCSFSSAWNEEGWNPSAVAAEITASERALKQAQEREAKAGFSGGSGRDSGRDGGRDSGRDGDRDGSRSYRSSDYKDYKRKKTGKSVIMASQWWAQLEEEALQEEAREAQARYAGQFASQRTVGAPLGPSGPAKRHAAASTSGRVAPVSAPPRGPGPILHRKQPSRPPPDPQGAEVVGFWDGNPGEEFEILAASRQAAAALGVALSDPDDILRQRDLNGFNFRYNSTRQARTSTSSSTDHGSSHTTSAEGPGNSSTSTAGARRGIRGPHDSNDSDADKERLRLEQQHNAWLDQLSRAPLGHMGYALGLATSGNGRQGLAAAAGWVTAEPAAKEDVNSMMTRVGAYGSSEPTQLPINAEPDHGHSKPRGYPLTATEPTTCTRLSPQQGC
ncbi:hypothetical protein HYH02_015412 [Chlamydomonas schloesseri]|uniref:Uncharacterized protein n=1 Tax=Chlamydomonas schloesseri TaxID=2026947 RepID=A0A835S885_9CHLO|nr:hypothetical protein HYH02_015412 [Chlamydomonas schloesseri]|eukprot:KAG2422573.1 hypothetical protein HYH02_015412 [Chlamydomonas schloesseri]